jgi:hypothetical protein
MSLLPRPPHIIADHRAHRIPQRIAATYPPQWAVSSQSISFKQTVPHFPSPSHHATGPLALPDGRRRSPPMMEHHRPPPPLLLPCWPDAPVSLCPLGFAWCHPRSSLFPLVKVARHLGRWWPRHRPPCVPNPRGDHARAAPVAWAGRPNFPAWLGRRNWAMGQIVAIPVHRLSNS